MRGRIDGEGVDGVGDADVGELRIVRGVALLDDADGAAVAGDVDAAEAGIEFDDVGTFGDGNVADGLVLVEIHHREQIILLAGEERAVVLGVERHAVVAAAASDQMTAHDRVRRGINHRDHIQVLQIHIDQLRDRIVLEHPGLTLERQHVDDLVGGHVNDGDGFGAFVGDVELLEGRGVGGAVGLRFGGDFFYDFHGGDINDGDLVVARVGSVNFLLVGDVFDPLDAGQAGNGVDDFVRAQIEDVEISGAHVRAEKQVVVGIDGEVVEAAPGRAGQLDGVNLLQRLRTEARAGLARERRAESRGGCAEQEYGEREPAEYADCRSGFHVGARELR